jgi:hypothetical protein
VPMSLNGVPSTVKQTTQIIIILSKENHSNK